MWLRYGAEQAKVPKEPIPANEIRAETRNETSQIVALNLEVRDSSVPSADEERSDMTSKQTEVSYEIHRSDSSHNQKWKFGVIKTDKVT